MATAHLERQCVRERPRRGGGSQASRQVVRAAQTCRCSRCGQVRSPAAAESGRTRLASGQATSPMTMAAVCATAVTATTSLRLGGPRLRHLNAITLTRRRDEPHPTQHDREKRDDRQSEARGEAEHHSDNTSNCISLSRSAPDAIAESLLAAGTSYRGISVALMIASSKSRKAQGLRSWQFSGTPIARSRCCTGPSTCALQTTTGRSG